MCPASICATQRQRTICPGCFCFVFVCWPRYYCFPFIFDERAGHHPHHSPSIIHPARCVAHSSVLEPLVVIDRRGFWKLDMPPRYFCVRQSWECCGGGPRKLSGFLFRNTLGMSDGLLLVGCRMAVVVRHRSPRRSICFILAKEIKRESNQVLDREKKEKRVEPIVRETRAEQLRDAPQSLWGRRIDLPRRRQLQTHRGKREREGENCSSSADVYDLCTPR